MDSKDECILVADVFKTKVGKEFFNLLRDRLIQPVADPDKEASHAYFREGENELIRKLFQMNESGTKYKSEKRDERIS